ncbi:ankyrin repeat protein [Verticillium dahliae VdLs.17]|uniref:Ankyrin repeat protein n=1 Tax=Verticillium dahliae (strain VdLs.17 / ATCC MYA-4575 / FGSC 10137) TaxID=498257 RepID=G2WXR2_VERDV|nr:ankyrin repeat protein [Verticillium dahliae VdLs.17]EGY20870.1 ankyrin repeat protein [Verticillium dahliae VdLs.17]
MPPKTQIKLNGLLDNNGRRIPLALVTEWDRHSVRVVCPYCSSRHCHGIGRLPRIGQTRESHCYRDAEDVGSQQYQLCYPDEPAAKDYFYELDKECHRFRTVGVMTPDEDADSSDYEYTSDATEEHDEMDELHRGLENLNIAREDPLRRQQDSPASMDEALREWYRDPSWRLSMCFSLCITNDIPDVERLIGTYRDPLLRSKDWQGENCISFAAIEGHLEMVQLLHKHGGSIHNSNKKGRTPLMEAVLWGRLKVAKFLLKQGADPNMQDRKGRIALFYALPSTITARMRATKDHYVERSTAESNRRVIAITLRAYEPITAETEANDNVYGGGDRFILNTMQSQMTFVERSTTYDIPDSYKTIARLDRGTMFPIVSAASGWKTDFAIDLIINNRSWTGKVRELCNVLGYELPADGRDRSEPVGTYFASHAEKKLIAYYIDKHMVLPWAALKYNNRREGGDWIRDSTQFQDLTDVQPMLMRGRAKISISRSTCADCTRFVRHVEQSLGLCFQVETR